MKRCSHLIRTLQLAPIAFLLAGCVVTQKVYLNQADVEGPIASLPLNPRIEEEPPNLQITPRIAIGGAETMHGKVTISSRGSYSRSDGSMTWTLPSTQYGLDVMLHPSANFGLGLGMTLSSVSGRSQSIWRIGMQYSNLREGLGVALDAGIQFSSLRVRARTTVITEINSIFGSGQFVDNFDDTFQKTGLGWYVGLTLNSAFPESRVNFFLNGGVVWQSLLFYSASVPDPIYGPGDGYLISSDLHESLAFASVTPGITLELGNQNRLLFGTRLILSIDVDDPEPQPIFQPVIQFTLGL